MRSVCCSLHIYLHVILRSIIVRLLRRSWKKNSTQLMSIFYEWLFAQKVIYFLSTCTFLSVAQWNSWWLFPSSKHTYRLTACEVCMPHNYKAKWMKYFVRYWYIVSNCGLNFRRLNEKHAFSNTRGEKNHEKGRYIFGCGGEIIKALKTNWNLMATTTMYQRRLRQQQ